MPKIKYVKFQELLLRKFPDEHDVRTTAFRMNIPESTFYHYIEGASTFPVDFLPRLYKATNDPDFLNFILDDTDMMLTTRAEGDAQKTLLQETLDVAGACGRLSDTVQEAMEDGNLSRNDKDKILKAINKGHKELEDLKLKVKR